MNIIQYLTIGIHTCFRIKKPPQKKTRYLRNLRQIFNQKCGYLRTKIEKSKIFLSPFLTSSYLCLSCQKSPKFRLKRAHSPNYRGASFLPLAENRPGFVIRKWPIVNRKGVLHMATEAQIYAFCLLLFPFSLIPFPFCEAGISTTVKSPLQITPFYAKQTQFAESPNECKLIYNKGLQKKRRFRSPKKQTQFKPNSNPIKPNFRKAKMNVTSILTKDYENISSLRAEAKQTQYEPKQSQFARR